MGLVVRHQKVRNEPHLLRLRAVHLRAILSFPQSPVFDPVHGFGSLVQNGPGPVTDGPFSNYRLSFGMGRPLNITLHQLKRNFDATMLPYLTQSNVDSVLRQATFERFRVELEGGPFTSSPKIHDGGHEAVGGHMADLWASPGGMEADSAVIYLF